MKTPIISVVLSFLLLGLNSFAQEAQEIKRDEKYRYLKVLTYIEKLTGPLKRHLKKNKIDLNFFVGVLQGYDNNVNLDPERKKAGFLETSLNTELVYNYTDDIRLIVENDVTDILYYDVTDADLFDAYTEAGFEVDLFNNIFTVGGSYAFDFAWFPNDKDGTYISNQGETFIKHRIDSDLYHKIGYTFLRKNFSHDKTRGSDGNKRSTLRADSRNSMTYEMGLYLDNAILKTNFESYRNDGNNQYYDYYDFWSFGIRPSFIFMITERFYTSGSFTYQQKRYDDRLSTEDDEHVYDDTYSFNVSLLYDLTESFTITLNCSYRENSSNEPLQKYSGSMFTGGLYYSF